MNACEHGDHPAPEGQRFCSEDCRRCEQTKTLMDGCAGVCGLPGDDGAANDTPSPARCVCRNQRHARHKGECAHGVSTAPCMDCVMCDDGTEDRR